MREATLTKKPLLQRAAVDWRDLDGLVLVVATVMNGCWGSVKGNPPTSLEDETRSHVAGVGQ